MKTNKIMPNQACMFVYFKKKKKKSMYVCLFKL